ncbi:hypothetical protein [Pedobacter rhizosphaerae]|uniref:Uncharacterized protein n=1 Tax=Pedobacter rhizosphaerae TaxID=390241 RepID=A0A1H9N6D5_9SPHI|nr:hypothetical protein [Pedobacter rhizosphaerae]SER31229.1 hypothetical protein SAMN04488023_10757 [Pedobacter rhizosphaerae]
MDQNNLEYLQKTLDYLGFGTRLNEVLSSAIYRELESFSLGINQRYIPAEFRSDPTKMIDQAHFQLNFSRSGETGMYFLNTYQLTLKRYNAEEPIQQTFDLEKHHRISALQAYRLTCGLSLEKEILQKREAGDDVIPQRIPVWLKLDLSVSDDKGNHPLMRFYPGYGYDLRTTLDNFAFLGLEDPEKKDAVIKALRFGNLIELSLAKENGSQQVYVAANPKLKTLDLYSMNMQPIKDLSAVLPKNENLPDIQSTGVEAKGNNNTITFPMDSVENRGRGR